MKLVLKNKQKETNNIWSFFFEPLEEVKWFAGQSIRLELSKPTWGVDERRFSIASAPYEKHIQVTTRISKSYFKRSLNKLEPGDIINGAAVEGEFIWGKSKKPRLFIAGGIGITAFRPLLAQAIHDKKEVNTTLMYSFSDDNPLFQEEFDTWRTKDPTLYVRYLKKQRIKFDNNSTLSSFWRDNLVYISGPERMVNETAQALNIKGLPENQLRLDRFTGDIKT